MPSNLGTYFGILHGKHHITPVLYNYINRNNILYFQIVFIPIWIIMCTAMIGVLYVIILAIILIKSPDIIPQQRRGNISSAIGYSLMVVPLLVFEVRTYVTKPNME